MLTILKNNRGLTLIELVVTAIILSLLGALVVPSARLTVKRTKEIELRRNLREIRDALDSYKKYRDQAVLEKKITASVDESGYPKTLQTLVDGDDFGGLLPKKKFLRRIPRDPFFPVKGDEIPWRMRSYTDDPDSRIWGGQDVFDVSSQSEETAIDGTKYKDW
ncbi:type II secretion system pseudopilin PulG [Geomonas sp. Red276]